MKLCKACKWRQHPAWAQLLPGYMICTHPNAGDVGRLDVQRLIDDDDHCGKSAKWWEAKED